MPGEHDLKRKLAYLILGQRGGQNRVQIIRALKERPYNLNQLAETLELNYRTIKHHINILLKNDILSTSSTNLYGQVYFLSPDLENHYNFLDDVSQKLSGITTSSKLLQTIIEQTDEAIIIVDKGHEVLFWNDGAVRLFGYGQEETIGHRLSVFREVAPIDERLRAISTGKKVPRFTTQMVSKDGRKITANVTIDAVKDEKDGLVGYSLIIHDDTEQIKVQEALKASEQRYALAQHIAGIVSWEWDVAKDRMDFSEDPRPIFGKGTKVTSLKQFLGRVDPDDRDEVEMTMKAAAKGKKSHSLQYRVQRRDGTVRWISHMGGVVKGVDGGSERIIGIIQDITEKRENERKHSAILDTTKDGFFLTDMKGRIIEVNSAFCNTIGYSQRQLLSRSIGDFEALETPEETARHIKKVEEDGYDSFETRLRRKDGVEVDVEISVSYLNMEGGRMIVFCRDISPRKRTEEVLRLSERRFALAQKAAEMGSWDWDIVTGDLFWSDSIEPMFGFAQGKFKKTYKAFLDCVHPDDRKYVEESVDDAVERNRPYDIEHRIVWPDGSIHLLSEKGEVFRDGEGKPIRMMGIVRDITGRRGRELMQETILQAAPDAIEITDTKGNIIEVNEVMSKMLGYSFKELRTMSSKDIRQERPDAIARQNKAVMERGRDTFETKNRRKDGSLIDVEVNARFIDFADGRIVNIVRDITERKKFEAQVHYLASFPSLNPNPILEFDLDGHVCYHNPATDTALRAVGLKDPAVFLRLDPKKVYAELKSGRRPFITCEVRLGDRTFIETISLVPTGDRMRAYTVDVTDLVERG